MQTFDQSIFQLYKDGHITAKEAMENASNPEDLKLRMEGVTTAGGGDWGSFDKDEEEDKSYLDQYQPTDEGDY